MSRLVAIGGLILTATGLFFTVFGTQYSTTIGPAISHCDLFCFTEAPFLTNASFILNYVGVFLAVLGAVVFGVAYPVGRFQSEHPA